MPDLLVTSLSGLRAYQTALATTSHNIANVGNESYTRQRTEFDARLPARYGSSFIGQGVDVTNITRIYDSFLVENMRVLTSSTSSLSTLQELATRVESLTANENSGLTSAMDKFFGALNDVANNPSSSAPRIALIGAAEILQQRFNALGDTLRDMDQEVDNRIVYAINDINALTSVIASVNSAITANSSIDNQPNDLLDKRDALLKQLAEKVSISVITQSDGTLNVFAGTGQLLVSGAISNRLVAQASVVEPDRLVVALQSASGSTVDISSSINGGVLGGLLDFRNNVLDVVQNRLGRTAIALAETFNAQHVQGYNLNGDLGTSFFSTVGTGNLSGRFGGDYLANGFNVGDTVDFDLQFDGQTIPVSYTVAVGDTNATIAAGIVASMVAGGVVDNGDGTYTLSGGTTTGVSMTFEIRGDQIQFTTAGGPSSVGNNLVITNVVDDNGSAAGVGAVINIGLLGSSSTQFNSTIATTGLPATFIGPSNSTLSNTNNTGTGVVNFSITDVTQLTVSDYLVSYVAANTYTVVRQSDNFSFPPGPGPFNIDGMTITPGGAPNVGDSFYLRPTRLGATSFNVEVSDIREIAAAAPLRTLRSVNNIGTLGIANNSVTDATDPDLLRTVDISFDPANPAGTFDVIDRATATVLQNNVLYSPGMTVSQNGWQIQITGVPQPGDMLTVTENTSSMNDNRNMLLLAALQNRPVMDGNVTTFEQSYAALTAEVGVLNQQAKSHYDVEKVLMDNAVADRESLSGVNLDEEAADLIRFQQAYQALSRVIQTSQTLFESLLSAV